MRFVGAVVDERLLAFQRALVEDYVVGEQVGKSAPLDGVAVGVVRWVKLLDAGRVEGLVGKFGYEVFLRFEYPLQLLLVVFALNRAHELALYLLLGVGQQGVVDVFADGLSRLVDVRLGLFLHEGPVVFLRHAERTLHAAVLVELGVAVLVELRGDDKLFHQALPFGRFGCRAVVHHAVLQHDVIPRVLALALSRVPHVDYLEGVKLLKLAFVFVLLLAAQLVVASLLVEVQQQPCQFLFVDGLRKGLLAQVVNSPVVRHERAAGEPFGLVEPEVGKHFGVRLLEDELVPSAVALSPGQLAAVVVLKLAVARQRGRVVFGQEAHDV